MRRGLFASLFVLSASAATAAINDGLTAPRADAWDACRDTTTLAAAVACTDIINGSTPLSPERLAEAYYNRGAAYFRNGNPERALGDLDRVVSLNPEFVSARVLRGAARAQTGDLDAALVDFTSVLAVRPDDPLVLVDRARTFAAKGDLGNATKDVSKAIMIDPKFAFAFAVRGALNEAQGRTGEARADFSKALMIDPNLAIARAGLTRLTD
jgi:tetratricopeptide (TPR) repeat protein